MRSGRILASAVVGIVLLALAVAFAPSVLAPWVARELSARTGVPVRIGWIAWNPVRGWVAFHNVRVATTADTPPIITIASVRIEVALRPLLARELVITRLVLAGPWVALRRTPSGDFNVAALFPAAGARPMPAPPPAPGPVAERALRIGALRIEGGSVEFRDETTSPILETSLHLKDVTADDLVVALAGRTDVRCHLESRLERQPLTLDLTYRATGADTSLSAKLTAAGASLARTLLYLPLGWRQVTGTLDATLDYARETADGRLRRHTIAATASIRDLALGEPWAPEATFRARGARLESIGVDFVRRRTDVGPIAVEDFRALIARDEHGVHVPLVASGGAAGGQGWRTTLAKVTLGSGEVVLRNVVPGREGEELSVPVSAGAVQVEPEAVTFDIDASAWGGKVEARGQADERATEIRFGLTGLSLPQVAARLGSPVGFTESPLEGSLVGRFTSEGPGFSGMIHLPGGRSLPPDPARPAEIFAWQDVTIELTELALAPLRVRLGRVTAAWPYLMISRSPHGLFPLRLADRAAGDGTLRSDGARPTLAIDALEAHGTRVEFYDTTLPAPYWTELANADLVLERITAPPVAIERLRVKGELDEISPVEAHGTIGPDASDVNIRAEQVRLAPLGPYLEPVLGYQVTSGVARVDSRVRLQGAELHASNDVVLSRFALAGSGEDALQRELGAPLSVALALMKDYRGDIRLSLPITGDLAAQEYRVENVVPTALREALIGTLRAPVTLLGSVFHRDEGERFDLRPIPFPPASAELDPPGEERIGQIAGLLTRQPGLVAVLIPEPSAADATALHDAAAMPSVDEQLRTLADARATVVTRRLVDGHHVARERVHAMSWQPGEPLPDAPPGVDVQLRGGAS